MEPELWPTAILNRLFGGPVSAFLRAIGVPPENPAHPIPNYLALEILVVVFMMVLLAWVRARLSADRPGKLQQLLEMLANGLGSQTEEIVGHGGLAFLPFLFTIFVFILLCNILGEIPHLGTPTQSVYVTVGCSLAALVYYHYHGVRHHGVFGYLRTFGGPILAIAWLMFPIEIVSHLARGLSLSVRLYANMLAGEKITEIIFEKILGIGAPVIFMGLHLFVGALQAYIFVLLTMIYLSGAVSEEH